MYVDADLIFADALAITTAETADCTNYIDLDAAGRLEGEPIYLVILVTTTFTSGGSATLQFDLEADADGTFSAGAVNLYSSDAIAVASLVEGYRIVRPINIPDGLRYLNLEYTIGVADMTAGAFDAFIALDVPADA